MPALCVESGMTPVENVAAGASDTEKVKGQITILQLLKFALGVIIREYSESSSQFCKQDEDFGTFGKKASFVVRG